MPIWIMNLRPFILPRPIFLRVAFLLSYLLVSILQKIIKVSILQKYYSIYRALFIIFQHQIIYKSSIHNAKFFHSPKQRSKLLNLSASKNKEQIAKGII